MSTGGLSRARLGRMHEVMAGHDERVLSAALKKYGRDRATVATKVWTSGPHPAKRPERGVSMDRKELKRSLWLSGALELV